MEDHPNTKKELDEMFQFLFFDEKRCGKFLWMVKMHMYWYETGSPSFSRAKYPLLPTIASPTREDPNRILVLVPNNTQIS